MEVENGLNSGCKYDDKRVKEVSSCSVLFVCFVINYELKKTIDEWMNEKMLFCLHHVCFRVITLPDYYIIGCPEQNIIWGQHCPR